MNRALTIALVLLVAVSAGATDRLARDPDERFISTTGRIVKIDAKNKILKVRDSDAQSLPIRGLSFAQVMQGLKGFGVTLPGGITISLPGRTRSTQKSSDKGNNLAELTVITTQETVFQDGGDPLRFEDFKSGEVISIHGNLSGSTLTATRVARWF
jgi:hypothetical protein